MTSQEDICDNVANNNINNNEELEEKKIESQETMTTADDPCAKEDSKQKSSKSEKNPNELTLKVVFAGAIATGAKSSLVTRIVKGIFDDHIPPTIGAAYLVKQITFDGVQYRLEIWGLFRFLLSLCQFSVMLFCYYDVQQILLAKKGSTVYRRCTTGRLQLLLLDMM